MMERFEHDEPVTLDDLPYTTESERDALEATLEDLAEIGWVTQVDDGTWTPGWKAAIFTTDAETDTNSRTPEHSHHVTSTLY